MGSSTIQLICISLFTGTSCFSLGLYLFSFRKEKQPYLLYFALFLISMLPINLMFMMQLSDQFSDTTLLQYLSYSPGVFFFLFYEQLFGPGKFRINRILWQIHLFGWILVILLPFISSIRLENINLPYSVLYIVSIIFVTVTTIIKAGKGNTDAKIFMLGLFGLTVTLIIDIFSAIETHTFASWQSTTLGLVLFSFCLAAILIRKYRVNGFEIFFEPLSFHRGPLELKMRADSMIMHTLKNEIQRLLYLNERTKKILPYLQDKQQEELENNIAAMERAMCHMHEMVHAVKRTDDISLKLSNINLNTLILDTLDIFDTEQLQKKVSIKTNLSILADIKIDPLHIKETVLNLLSNSIEAIEHDDGIIELRLFREKHEIVLEISDNGKGIPEEDIQNVVIPLFTTKKNGAHYGIGLYYAYFVMEKHGGSLSIPYSKIGKGTTIQLRFPSKT